MFGIFLVVLGGIFWAFSGVLAEYLFKNHFSVEWVSFYRLLLTGLILIAISFRKSRMKLFKNRSHIISLVIFGLLGLFSTQYSYFKAISYTDAGTATMIQYSAPLMIMIIVCLRNKVLPRFNESLALVLIIAGLFLLATGGDFKSLNLNLNGLLWATFAAFGIVFYSLCARDIIIRYGLFFIMGWASLIGALALFIILGGNLVHYDFIPNLYLAQAGIILIGTIGAFCLYLKGVEYIGALKASMIACVEPVAAALMSFLFLGTTYTLLDILGFAFIVISVILNAKR